MATVIKPPYEIPANLTGKVSIFLAGSIEMGKAEDWQSELQNALIDEDVVLLSPRRDDWDSSWEQSITNPNFFEQVTWELNHIDKATWVVMYFDPNTKSPITLLELGILTANPDKLLVCCPDGYWRKGNVDVVCQRYGIAQVPDKDTMITTVKRAISVINDQTA